MISLTTKAFLQPSHILNFKIPDEIKLQEGEYEIVIVINPTPLLKTKKKKLTFSNHQFCLKDPNETFNREDIYDEFGR